ncbi:Pcf11 protein [Maudiozyma humilis]|uniref:Pcf11 protein n=1 Tax=Maudiozyma humilis TaxID=51915 RepID=A0AAV5RXT8_MAUHU|nr:Pcf11 protein [Kazachstania humilis]
MDEDMDNMVKEFTDVLEELTFNSKPIITTLTKMAEENISCAQPFVEALENRISKCVPTQKLCAFYALDSICKNAGSPYTIYFSKNLFALYKKTYLLVDNTTRSKLISLFKTWMMPTESTGAPLFESAALTRIENFLIKASALHQKNYQSKLPTPTIPLLLADIDRLTKLTEMRLQKSPTDSKLNVKLQVLGQLKQELQKGKLGLPALKQVQLQLKEIFSQDQQLIQQQMDFKARNQQRQQMGPGQGQGSAMMRPDGRDSDSQASHSTTPISLFDTTNGPNVSSLFGSSSGVLDTKSIREAERSNKKAKLESLYKSLGESGLLFTPSQESIVTLYDKVRPKGSNSHDDTPNIVLPPVRLLEDILFDCKAYFANVNINISAIPSLSFSQYNVTADNLVVQNNLIHLLYRAKSNKCSTCGKRFGNSNDEKRLFSEHLDWHFRINKRIKGSSQVITSNGAAAGATATQKNIQSRNWFLRDEEWANFKDSIITSTRFNSDPDENRNNKRRDNRRRNRNDDLREPGNNYNGSTSVNMSPGDSPALNEVTLRNLKVVVPESTENMSFQCPICKDSLDAVYDEDTGEWIWRNAVEINGKHFHALCYYESVKNNSNEEERNLGLQNLQRLIK